MRPLWALVLCRLAARGRRMGRAELGIALFREQAGQGGGGFGQVVAGLEYLPDAALAEPFLTGQLTHGGAAGSSGGGMAAELPDKADAAHGGQQEAAARYIDDRSAKGPIRRRRQSVPSVRLRTCSSGGRRRGMRRDWPP